MGEARRWIEEQCQSGSDLDVKFGVGDALLSASLAERPIHVGFAMRDGKGTSTTLTT